MADDSGVRVGRVSSINYEAGTVRVTYPDKDGDVTTEVPFAANGTYNMPRVGSLVDVAHNSNGNTHATVHGTTWNGNNTPYEGYEGLYRREMANTKNKAFERYDNNTNIYTRRIAGRAHQQANEVYDEATGRYGITAGGNVVIVSRGASASMQATAGGVGLTAAKAITMDAANAISAEAGANISVVAKAKYLREVGGTLADTIKGAATITFKGTRRTSVTGKVTNTFKGMCSTAITGKTTLSCKAAVTATLNSKLTADVKGNATITLKAKLTASIKGNATVAYKGKLAQEVTGDAKETYKAKLEKEVTGDAKESYKAKLEQEVTGDYSLKVGPCTVTISPGGDVTVTGATSYKMEAPDGDIKIHGVSLLHHKHKEAGQGEPEQ